MVRILRNVFVGLLVLLLAAAVVLPALGVLTVRRSFPQMTGEVRLDGLDGPVDVFRDGYGVPHIYAASTHDLFFAQGYIHAQDRFYQMDFWRHTGSGRLSEMLGDSTLETDQFLRTMGWARVAQQELDLLDAETLAILEAYAGGVNAYLADHKGSALSLEYAILPLINPGYEPEPWTPLHSMTWAKAMAWDLGSNMDAEIERAVLLRLFTPEQLAEIIPGYPAESPVIVPAENVGERAARPSQAALPPDAVAALERVTPRLSGLERWLGPVGRGIGSNNWTISGALTESGMPLLANDPHLSVQMPSIWYEIGLHCQPVGPDCPFNVTGFSFAGDPGVILGHNDRIAWGVTNLAPDVQDLFIEKLNPENPNQYEVNGEWVDMTTVEETIQVAGGDPVPITVRYTRHGPIISDTYGSLEDFGAQAGVDLPESYAVAMSWTALNQPSYLFRAIVNMNTAQNWEEFREAVRDFTVPAQNLVYADVDGNIGYQMPGLVPIRANGDGSLPVPGWTDEYEWEGYIPFEELPFAFNPPQGYIATANNAVVGEDYPYLITADWDYGYRARRIVEMIESAPGPITAEYITQMHGDARSLNAERLVPLLMQVPMQDERLEERKALLEGWDYQEQVDSAPAALFEVFWKRLLVETFQDDLPEDFWPRGGDRWFEVVYRLADQPQSAWWDDRETAETEGRDDIFRRAWAQAVAEVEERLGRDPAQWAWSDLHTVTFRNATLGESGIAPVEALFNRGPFAVGGGSDLVNATSWDAAETDATESYKVRALPSMRMIVDLGDLANSQTIHTTGQSGHAYHPHYIDMAELWATLQYHPMLWERQEIEAAGGGHLRLVP